MNDQFKIEGEITYRKWYTHGARQLGVPKATPAAWPRSCDASRDGEASPLLLSVFLSQPGALHWSLGTLRIPPVLAAFSPFA